MGCFAGMGAAGLLAVWVACAYSSFEVEVWPTGTSFLNVSLGDGAFGLMAGDCGSYAGCRYPGSRIIAGGAWSSSARWGFKWPECRVESFADEFEGRLLVPFWLVAILYGIGVSGWWVWRSRRHPV